jgi:predicted phosphohydrolase
MKIFAISDLHLSFQVDKPMDLFGDHWAGYEQRIMDDWNSKVGVDDIGIIAGDLSWAMRLSETEKDFNYLSKLNGTKIIIRGNHDYWWSTISKVRSSLPVGAVALQNDSVRFEDTVFCGTRGWRVPERNQKQNPEDKKIFDREILRFEMSLQDAAKKLPKNEDGTTAGKLIAILHYPPFNVMRDDSPFTALCEKYNVTACVYGHLHGKNCRAEIFTNKGGVKYYLTSCDLLKHQVMEIN